MGKNADSRGKETTNSVLVKLVKLHPIVTEIVRLLVGFSLCCDTVSLLMCTSALRLPSQAILMCEFPIYLFIFMVANINSLKRKGRCLVFKGHLLYAAIM